MGPCVHVGGSHGGLDHPDPHALGYAVERRAELAKRRTAMETRGALAWKPANRKRQVSAALQAYAAMTTSADTGAVRDVSQLKR